jgi:hypothetical protein
MGKWEFYDDDDEIDLTESESDPSFSFYDFRKWLTTQKRKPESIRETQIVSESSKEELKEVFKQKMRDKVQKKIEDKMSDIKKNKS